VCVLCGRVPAKELECCHAEDTAPYMDRAGCRVAPPQCRCNPGVGGGCGGHQKADSMTYLVYADHMDRAASD